MKDTKNNQNVHEHKEWQKDIERLRQENALLKYRLSEMVDKDEENRFLQMAEYFQNELLLKDEMLKKLIKDLQEYSNVIEGKSVLSQEIINTHGKLRDNILEFEKNFKQFSKEFNEKMLESSKH